MSEVLVVDRQFLIDNKGKIYRFITNNETSTFFTSNMCTAIFITRLYKFNYSEDSILETAKKFNMIINIMIKTYSESVVELPVKDEFLTLLNNIYTTINHYIENNS